ncbi:MAG: hypothetical protein UX56_C0014G0016 [Candidatus Azambacteria bacterium GW2011_GWD2_46_48]|uniref:Uncharacterized protein n=1 Tax=Candidatus Azambacteria bacterium GW2011_GWD2_46_48 TaxID=1618623 RepID=A0A0G1QAB3_9BACT|nr:MAG: hypothetical protein UX56_C0014G0016 [Candidatus Azambacteria bacterium GW2011_GWD2_46_48]
MIFLVKTQNGVYGHEQQNHQAVDIAAERERDNRRANEKINKI